MIARTAWSVVGGEKGGARRCWPGATLADVPEGCWGSDVAGGGGSEGGMGLNSSGWESR